MKTAFCANFFPFKLTLGWPNCPFVRSKHVVRLQIKKHSKCEEDYKEEALRSNVINLAANSL